MKLKMDKALIRAENYLGKGEKKLYIYEPQVLRQWDDG